MAANGFSHEANKEMDGLCKELDEVHGGITHSFLNQAEYLEVTMYPTWWERLDTQAIYMFRFVEVLMLWIPGGEH